MQHRKDTGTDTETAVAVIKHEGRGEYVASPHTCSTYEIPVRKRPFEYNELIERIDEKVDALLEAVTPERIAEANLFVITRALSTFLDKRQRLVESNAVTPRELEQRQQLVAEIILRHVSDPKERAAIVAEFDRLGQRDSDTGTTHPRTDPSFGLMDTDEGK